MKTKSQIVRYLIKLLWIADESELTEEAYYQEKIDKYIEFLKGKLKEKQEFMDDLKELAKDYE